MKYDKRDSLPVEGDYEKKKFLMKLDKRDIIDRYFYRRNRAINVLLGVMIILVIAAYTLGFITGNNSQKEIKQTPIYSYDDLYNACNIPHGKTNWDVDLNKCHTLIIQRTEYIEQQYNR